MKQVTLRVLVASMAIAMVVPAGTQETEANVRLPGPLGKKILENAKNAEEELMAATDKAPTKTEGKQIEMLKTVPAEEKTEADGKEPAAAGEKRTKMVATLPADEKGSPKSEMKKPTKMGEEVTEKTEDSETETGTDEDDEDEHKEEEVGDVDFKDYDDNPTCEQVTKQEILSSHCSNQIGRYLNSWDVWIGLEVKYDLPKLLEKYGGPPGKVNATWSEPEDAPVDEKDKDKRPLPDADEKYWIYRYGDTDSKTYIRIEHAVHRFSKTPKEFLEVRGQLYFTPEDFCGRVRKVNYVLDDHGFIFEVTHEYCDITSEHVSCASPSICWTDENCKTKACVGSPHIQLLASLLGGGK